MPDKNEFFIRRKLIEECDCVLEKRSKKIIKSHECLMARMIKNWQRCGKTGLFHLLHIVEYTQRKC
jgi:hypothetical protein